MEVENNGSNKDRVEGSLKMGSEPDMMVLPPFVAFSSRRSPRTVEGADQDGRLRPQRLSYLCTCAYTTCVQESMEDFITQP
jgi:hypothetical protein